jgi:predicted GH43/DUF377 family glycosyl hydrolase
VALALTRDFKEFSHLGLILKPDNKDAALFPRRIGGTYAILHRPHGRTQSHIWIAYSDDLRKWHGHAPVLRARRGGWWDAGKIGLSPPLIETPSGWVVLYHGVRMTAAGALYRTGVALLDLEDPSKVLARGDEWILGPEAPYERTGDVGNVLFACGYTIGPDGDTINLYYGAADTSIGVATGSVSRLLEWLKQR